VRRDRSLVSELGKAVRQAAKDSLKAALRTMNQADLAPALQVFYNLQCLPQVEGRKDAPS
jgi:hypothetical protein